MNKDKTHYRKAFKSPYLSSADIVEPTVLTISHVQLAKDETKRTKDMFNTAYFEQKELRPGEPLKPMILNAVNSRTMSNLTGSSFIDDWSNIPVTVFVDNNVRFGRDTVEGLRISAQRPIMKRPIVNRDNPQMWNSAIGAYKQYGNFDAVLAQADMSNEDMQFIVDQVAAGNV